MARNSFGFTLVEMILVIVILGIVAAAAIPSVTSTVDGMKLDGAAREVLSAIQYVQSLAIKEGTQHGIVYDPPQNEFRCFSLAPGNIIRNPLDKKYYAVRFDDDGPLQGVDLATANFGGSKTVTFNSLGEPSAEGSVMLSYGSAKKTISISGLLGKASVN